MSIPHADQLAAMARRDRKRELRRTYGPATPLLRLQGRLQDLANIARHRVIDCSALAVELDAAAAEVMTILEAIAAETAPTPRYTVGGDGDDDSYAVWDERTGQPVDVGLTWDEAHARAQRLNM